MNNQMVFSTMTAKSFSEKVATGGRKVEHNELVNGI